MQIKNKLKIQAIAPQGECFPSDVLLPYGRNLLKRGPVLRTAPCYAQVAVSDAAE